MDRAGILIRPVPLTLTLLLLASALVVQPARGAVAEEDWLGRVNEIRQASGLPVVSENPDWTAGISAHLNYLVNTPSSYETGPYASAHTENPQSPYYTPEGDHEAESSDLAFGTTSDRDAIDRWLTAPFHAIGILRPGLMQVAFARDPASGDAGLDVISGWSGTAPPTQVLFPGSGSTIDLSRFGGESPTPIETCEAQNGGDWANPGLPFIALLTESPGPEVEASLEEPNGTRAFSGAGDLCVVTAENFISSDGVYGPAGESILSSDRAVLVIPRSPLIVGAYTVDITQPGKPDIEWSFNSQPPSGEGPTGPEEPELEEPGEVEEPPSVAPYPGSSFTSRLAQASANCMWCEAEVAVLRLSLAKHFMVLSLDNFAADVPVVFVVSSTGSGDQDFTVMAEGERDVRVPLRARGPSRVTVKVDSGVLFERRFRPHLRKR